LYRYFAVIVGLGLGGREGYGLPFSPWYYC
jgi:hypothetical protein